MGIEYIDTLKTYVSEGLFFLFKISVYAFTFITVISLLLLLIGQALKSQKVKDRFIKLSMSFFILLAFILIIPIIFIRFKI